jgi:hypothetical protein
MSEVWQCQRYNWPAPPLPPGRTRRLVAVAVGVVVGMITGALLSHADNPAWNHVRPITVDGSPGTDELGPDRRHVAYLDTR